MKEGKETTLLNWPNALNSLQPLFLVDDKVMTRNKQLGIRADGYEEHLHA